MYKRKKQEKRDIYDYKSIEKISKIKYHREQCVYKELGRVWSIRWGYEFPNQFKYDIKECRVFLQGEDDACIKAEGK
ncbi:MAG: hypothetical protein IJP29_07000 [Lachnospiraceae bacterium]|nr:hypothetical protein [Lachnospiraceae bacterium]